LLFAFSVTEAHGFKLVKPEFADLHLRQRNPRRFVQVVPLDSTAIAHLLLAWHNPSSIDGKSFRNNASRALAFFCAYEHNKPRLRSTEAFSDKGEKDNARI
jgi:hypothetical protein